MELSQESLELIQIAGDTGRIGDKIFAPFLLSTVESLFDQNKKADITGNVI